MMPTSELTMLVDLDFSSLIEQIAQAESEMRRLSLAMAGAFNAVEWDEEYLADHGEAAPAGDACRPVGSRSIRLRD